MRLIHHSPSDPNDALLARSMSAASLLEKRGVVIQVQARFALAAEVTFEMADLLTGQLMDLLILDTNTQQPDTFVSMTEGEFGRIGVDMLVDTDQPHVALDRASGALRAAFEAAAQKPSTLNVEPFGLLTPDAYYRAERVPMPA